MILDRIHLLYGKLCDLAGARTGVSRICAIVGLNVINYGASLFVFILPYVLLSSLLYTTGGMNQFVSSMIAGFIFAGLAVVLSVRFKLSGVRAYYPSKSFSGRRFLVWTVYGFAIMYIVFLLFCWSVVRFDDSGMKMRAGAAAGISPVIYAVYSLIVAPVVEECIFRMFLYRQFKRTSPWWVAMLLSSFIFAALHGTAFHMLFALIFGVFLTLSYEYNGTISVCMFYHIIYNFMTASVLPGESVVMNQLLIPVLGTGVVVVMSVQSLLLHQDMSPPGYLDWSS